MPCGIRECVTNPPNTKVEAENDYRRFKFLEPRMERLITMQESLQAIREGKQLSFQRSQEADKALEKHKELEKLAADRISNDHVVADEQRVGVAELFPTVQLGYIICSVNGNECEDMPYEEIMGIINENFPPHTLELRRYDYRQNISTGEWESLQEMRDQKKYVEDPRLVRSFFVDTCRKGLCAEIGMRLRRGGERVNGWVAEYSTLTILLLSKKNS